MNSTGIHHFHIPVMGIGFTIDTPLKVAKYGISSVISLANDELMEQMRKFYSEQYNEDYYAIEDSETDYRARRITAYLNLANKLVRLQFENLITQPFEPGSEITKYFELLPDDSALKTAYNTMMQHTDPSEKIMLQQHLRTRIKPGAIDVNIMVKLNKLNYNSAGEPLPAEFADGISALRGFGNSDLHSSVIFSAGYNPQVYSYAEHFEDFFPDKNGYIKKKVIIKVSNYRSALVQGKVLAKKGILVSEFRIESGLNCGGHAFATEGLLLGPILEELKNNREALEAELLTMCNDALVRKQKHTFTAPPGLKITVQGGLGTANEQKFILEYYNVNGTGWGSPFLLVPEVTNVDKNTLASLATAKKEDYYLSNASPMGILFNNFRKSSSEKQRQERIKKGRPGSPCYKKFLSANTEFTKLPICTGSREYQYNKIKELQGLNLSQQHYESELTKITEKDCLCEGLSVPPLLKNNIHLPHNLSAVAICPGPNLAYFSGTFTLQQITDHIYGRTNILNSVKRPNFFINELQLYIDYLKKRLAENLENLHHSQEKYLQTFKSNLLEGINYYKKLLNHFTHETAVYIEEMQEQLCSIEAVVKELVTPVDVVSTT